MDINNPDPLELRIELEILRERQKHSDDKIRQLEKQFEQANTNLKRRERELEHIGSEYGNLNVKYEVLKADFQHAKDALARNSRAAAKKSAKAKLLAVSASVIFLATSALVNIGTSMLTSVPPNTSVGWVIMAIALIAYLVGTLITIVYVPEGEK